MSSDSGTVDLNAATVESSDEAHRVPLDDETVATPHNLTLYYASDTCKKISDFFPKEKICKHEGETVCIERSEAADILLNAGTMPRSFIELWSSSERGHGPKWFIKNKHASKKVEICHGGRPALLIQNQVAEVRNGCEIRLEKQGPQKLTFLVRIEDGDTLTGDFKVEVLPQEQMPLPGYGFNRQVSLASSSGHSDSSGSSGSDGQFSGMPNMFTPPTVTDLVTALVGLSLHTQLGSVRPQQCQYCHGPHNVCSHNTCMNCISHHSCGQASGLPPAMSVPRPCGGCGGGAAGGHQTPVPHAPPTAGSETTPQSAVQAVLSQNRFQPSLPPGIPVCDGTLPVSILHQNGGSIGPTELSSHAAHAASLNHTQYFQQPQQHHQLLSHGNEMHSSSQVSQVAGPLHGPLSMPVNNSYTNSVNNNSAYPVLPESSFYPSQHLPQAAQNQWQSRGMGAATLESNPQPFEISPSDLQPQRGVMHGQTTNMGIASAQPVQVASSSVDSLSGIHSISPRQAVSEGLVEVGYHQLTAETLNGLSSRVEGTEENQQQVLPNGGGDAFVRLTARQGPGATPSSLHSSDLHTQRTEGEISDSLLMVAANGNAVNLRPPAGLYAGREESSDFSSASSENVLDLRSNGSHRGREPQEDDERQPEEHDDQQRLQ